ncbi:MAG: hypothetical protein AB1297_07070 [bacterium]
MNKKMFKLGMAIALGMGMLCWGEDKEGLKDLKEKIYHYPAKVTVEDLFQAADCIVMGKVEKVKAKREIEVIPVELIKERLLKEEEIHGEKRMHLLDEYVKKYGKREMVYTYIKLIPEKWFKGEEKKEVVIRVMGGETEGLIVDVNYIGGTPIFKKKDRVFVFLEKEEPYFYVLGNRRGEYIIKGNKISNLYFGKEMFLKDFIKKIEEVRGK